jgi:hypothetical protein
MVVLWVFRGETMRGGALDGCLEDEDDMVERQL